MATLALDRPRAVAARAPVVEGLFFATVFTVTFAKLQWEVAGTLSFSDVVTFLFLFAFGFHRLERLDGRLTRAAWITLAFFAAFLLVYLIGFFNLDTDQSLAQWAKGMVKFLLHFLFLVAGIALIARRGQRLYWQTLAAFVLARYCASGSEALLYTGPVVIRQMAEVVEAAETAGTDAARLDAYRALAAIVSWLRVPLEDTTWRPRGRELRSAD